MGFSNRKYEKQFHEQGYRLIAGIDEVGMGCLAGPVVASAVILNWEDIPSGIDDSKRLTPKRRAELSGEIRGRALAYAIGIADTAEIDTLNIYHAARLAMSRAVQGLSHSPDFILLDGRGKIDCPIPQLAIVTGDHLSVSIGAASIVAKVYRDELMEQMDGRFPGYGFAKHKGYGSVFHRQCLQQKGPCDIHRKSFSWTPV